MEDRYAIRIAKALERIADALEAANANDPLTAIGKAMEAETQGVMRHCRNCDLILGPTQWICPNCGLNNGTSAVTNGAEKPKATPPDWMLR